MYWACGHGLGPGGAQQILDPEATIMQTGKSQCGPNVGQRRLTDEPVVFFEKFPGPFGVLPSQYAKSDAGLKKKEGRG